MKATQRGRTKARQSPATKRGGNIKDMIGLRGGIEIMLKNALTGEPIIHEKGENVVLYIGRNMLMTRALATASQTNTIWPTVVIGSGSTATQATHTGPQAYFTFKAGTVNQTTQSAGTGQPILNVVASWESTELTGPGGFQSVREFLLGFHTTTGSAMTPFLCRYLSDANISASTTNQLLVTYTVSF